MADQAFDAPSPSSGFGRLARGVRRLLGVSEPLEAAPALSPEITAPADTDRHSVVDLAPIREALGPRWTKVAPQVHTLAAAIIARRLEPGDGAERSGEDAYLVRLPRLRREEADILCRGIAKEIATRLLGADVGALPPSDIVPAEAPAGSGETLRPAFVATGRQEPGHHVTSTPLRGEQAEPAAWVDQAGPAQAPRRPWIDVDLGTGDVPRLSGGEAEPSEGSVTNAAVAPQWRYAPIWDFSQQALIRYRLQASVDQRQVHPYPGMEAAGAEAVLFENDLQALSRMTADFAGISAQGRRLPIICPIHYSSISLESRRSWLLHTLRGAPAALRRLLTIEIVRPHGALWTNSLHDFVGQLRGSGAGLAACLPLDRVADIPLIADCTRTISTQVPATGLAEKHCIELLGAFAARARQSKLESGVYGLTSRSLVLAASAAGFRFLSGEAIHAELETPDTATRFQAFDLYQASA